MGKYYDRLVEINESLDKLLEKKGIQFDEDDNETSVPISMDDLSPEQMKKAAMDKGLDKDMVDDMVKDGDNGKAELAGAMKQVDSEQANESVADVLFVLGVKDPDLDLDGYVKGFDGHTMDLMHDYGEGAMTFANKDEAQAQIDKICSVCNYDPSTFFMEEHTIEPEPEEDVIDDENPGIDDGEDWICLDPMNGDAVTI